MDATPTANVLDQFQSEEENINVSHSQSLTATHQSNESLNEANEMNEMQKLLKQPPSSWDPLSSSEWDERKPTDSCLIRIKRDITNICSNPAPGTFIVPDSDNITRIHALITGPFDTPYEGGFFYFLIRCPPDYPHRPPKVRFMTTGSATVRFNPNLYKNGKVCLSILGTWSGPGWTPAATLCSLVLSIQSIMCEKPYFNEPGFDREREVGDSEAYNRIVSHETLRVAVCDVMERNYAPYPKDFYDVIDTSFPSFYESYVQTCEKYRHLDGEPMKDPFGELRGTFDFAAILRRLQALRVKFEDRFDKEEDELTDDDEMDANEAEDGRQLASLDTASAT